MKRLTLPFRKRLYDFKICCVIQGIEANDSFYAVEMIVDTECTFYEQWCFDTCQSECRRKAFFKAFLYECDSFLCVFHRYECCHGGVPPQLCFEKEAIKKSPSFPRIWDERLGSAVPPMLATMLLTQKTNHFIFGLMITDRQLRLRLLTFGFG